MYAEFTCANATHSPSSISRSKRNLRGKGADDNGLQFCAYSCHGHDAKIRHMNHACSPFPLITVEYITGNACPANFALKLAKVR